MKNWQRIILGLILIFVFVLVYSPHFDYQFPFHIDEWRHITETLKLSQGQAPVGLNSSEIGFHLFLLGLSKITNLILIYKFLPAFWAVFSALALFYVAYKKTESNFLIALFTIVFFASVKSNTNVTGLWFFTPLTFSIPFIFLYIYFFTEGVDRQNKKYILISLAIMLGLVLTHAPSILFALPFLLVYSLINLDYLKKEWLFFLSFLLIPLVGILFYRYLFIQGDDNSISYLISLLQFKSGWGVLELKNSFMEIYSLIGYILAAAGIVFLLLTKEKKSKYLIYIFWPITSLILILIYRLSDVSYLIPYQRNFYYFVLSLPFLSAIGLFYLISQIKQSNFGNVSYVSKIILIVVLIFTALLAFNSYYQTPDRLPLYRVIDNDDYQALMFLAHYPPAKVMADPFVSTALYSISGHKPVGTIFFYGRRENVEKFFGYKDCESRQKFLEDSYNINYVLSEKPIDCGWELIYQKNNYIYKINHND